MYSIRSFAAFAALALLFAVLPIDATRKLHQAPSHARIVPRRYIVQIASNTEKLSTAATATEAGAVLDAVKSANIPVKKIRAFNSDVFRGLAVATETDDAAQQLLAKLNEHSNVAAIYPVTGITLPRPVKASPVAAAAAKTAAAAADDVAGSSADGLASNGMFTTPDPVPSTSDLLSKYQLKYGKRIEQSGGGGFVSIAADDRITYPGVELPLGPDDTIVKIKPSQSWGVADYLTNVTSLRQKYGLTGKGVRIGIIDSGVDYTHPAFGGCTAVNTPAGKCRVIAGYDFVGDEFDLPTDAPKPKSDPMDCSEVFHGTSVSGVAAAGYVPGGPMIGVAPEAELGVYKVYGCGGTGTTDALLAAIQRAADDKMDIINLSLGEPSGYAAEPWISIMSVLFKKGIIVIRTAGNEGSVDGGQGLFYADGHTASGALVVGGINTATADRRYIGPSAFSSMGPDPEVNLLPHILGPAEQLITTFGKGQYTTWDKNSPMEPVSGTSFAAPYLAGSIALTLQLHRQNKNASNRQSQGIAALQDSPNSDISKQQQTELIGVDSDTQQQQQQQQQHQFDQQFVVDQLIRTAMPWDTNGLLTWESTAKQGAGSFNIQALVTNPVITTPAYISLPSNYSIHRQDITLEYIAPQNDMLSGNITYKITHEGAAAYQIPIKQGWGKVGLTPFDNTVLDQTASVKINPEYVTLSPGTRQIVTVTFYLPQMMKKQPLMYSGYIRLNPVHNISDAAAAAGSGNSSSSSSAGDSEVGSQLPPVQTMNPPLVGVPSSSSAGSSSAGSSSSSSNEDSHNNSVSVPVSSGSSSTAVIEQQQQQSGGDKQNSTAQNGVQGQQQQQQQQPKPWMVRNIPLAPRRSDPVPTKPWPAPAAAAAGRSTPVAINGSAASPVPEDQAAAAAAPAGSPAAPVADDSVPSADQLHNNTAGLPATPAAAAAAEGTDGAEDTQQQQRHQQQQQDPEGISVPRSPKSRKPGKGNKHTGGKKPAAAAAAEQMSGQQDHEAAAAAAAAATATAAAMSVAAASTATNPSNGAADDAVYNTSENTAAVVPAAAAAAAAPADGALHLDQAAVTAAAAAAADIMNGAINGVLGRRWLLESQQAQGRDLDLSNTNITLDLQLPNNSRSEAGTDLENFILSSSGSSHEMLGYQVDGLLADSNSSNGSSSNNGSSRGSSRGPNLESVDMVGSQPDGLVDFLFPRSRNDSITKVTENNKGSDTPKDNGSKQHNGVGIAAVDDNSNSNKAWSPAAAAAAIGSKNGTVSEGVVHHRNPKPGFHNVTNSTKARSVTDNVTNTTVTGSNKATKGLVLESVPNTRVNPDEAPAYLILKPEANFSAAAAAALAPAVESAAAAAAAAVKSQGIQYFKTKAAGAPVYAAIGGGAAAIVKDPVVQQQQQQRAGWATALSEAVTLADATYNRSTSTAAAAAGNSNRSSSVDAAAAAAAADKPQQQQQQLPSTRRGLISESVPHHRLRPDGSPVNASAAAANDKPQQQQQPLSAPRGLISESVPHHRLKADGSPSHASAAAANTPQQQQQQQLPSAPRGLISESVPHHRLNPDGSPVNAPAAAANTPQQQQQQSAPRGLISESVPHHRLKPDGSPVNASAAAAAVNTPQQQQQQQPPLSAPRGLISESVPHHRLKSDGSPANASAAAADNPQQQQQQQQQQQPLSASRGLISESVPHHRLKPDGSPANAFGAAAAAAGSDDDGGTTGLAAITAGMDTSSSSSSKEASISSIDADRQAIKDKIAQSRGRIRDRIKSRKSDLNRVGRQERTGDLGGSSGSPRSTADQDSNSTSSSSSSSNISSSYSGEHLAPISKASSIQAVPLVIPYQGIVGYSDSMPVTMPASIKTNIFCYTPNTTNVLSDAAINPAMHVTDHGCEQMSVAPNSYNKSPAPVQVPLSQIQQYPCALTFTLAPIVPIRRLTVDLVDHTKHRAKLGTIQTLETPTYSRSPAGTPYSYCLNWGGVYKAADDTEMHVEVGQEYSMRALMEAPLALADRQAGMTPRIVPVDIQGTFRVTEG